MQGQLRFTLSALALSFFSCVPTAFGSDVYVDDSLAIYDYTPGGSQTTFSNLAGNSVLQMAFDSSGNLFAAARDNNALYEYAPDGTRSTFASLTGPYGLAIDSLGNIYTGAAFGGTLERFTAGVGTPIATGQGIQSLTTDGTFIYDNDSTHNIYQFTSTGTRTTYATGAPSGFGIAIDALGRVYVGDWINFTIDRYTPGSGWSTFGSLPTNQLSTSLAFDASGNLYADEVANGTSNCCVQNVYKFDSAGNRTTFATGLYNPYGLAIQQSQAAIPEPASVGLIAGGGLLFLVRRLRRGELGE